MRATKLLRILANPLAAKLVSIGVALGVIAVAAAVRSFSEPIEDPWSTF